MKVCRGCGERYHLRVDFCFRDGEELVAVDGATEGLPPLVAAGLPVGLPNRPELTETVAEPAPEHSSLWLAGAVLVLMLLLVPLVGGIVTGRWP